MTTQTNASPTLAKRSAAASAQPRNDVLWLWIGIALSAAMTLLIWVLGPRLATVPHWPDQGAAWYYWRLMDTTTAARVTAWGGYLLHQITIWALIYAGVRANVKPRYGVNMHWFNYTFILANTAFILLHIVQTHVWYGALAEDVSIWSSQWSVIIMLVLIVLMENRRRGLVFGKKVGFLRGSGDFVRRYHGYIFSWALIYTLWYHPAEATFGHLLGFFYTFLILLQGSLMFTRVHLNKYWGAALETLVLVHGTMVAVSQGNGLWPMFAFGFGGIFVVTIMYGLDLPRWLRWTALAAYAGLALWVYGTRDIADIHQITWIPVVYYLAVFAFAGLISLGLWIYARVRQPAETPSAAV